MPNIRTIGPEEWNVHPSEEGAAAYERVGRYIGQSWHEIGQDAQGVADSLAQQQAKMDQMKMNADLSQFQIDAHQNLTEYMKKADPSDPAAMQKWHDSYYGPALQKLNEKYQDRGVGSTLLDATTGNKYHDAVMEQFTRQQDMTTSNILDRATGEWANIQSRFYVQKAEETDNNFANMAHDNPEMLPSLVQQHSAFISGLDMDGATKEQLSKAGMSHMFDSAGDGIVTKAENKFATDPNSIQEAMDFVQDPKNGYYKYMSPGKYDQVMDKLAKAKEQYAGINSEVAALNMPTWKTAAENGNVDAYNQMVALSRNYVGANPKETAMKRAEYANEAEAAQATWKIIQPATHMSDEQIRDYEQTFQSRIANMTTDQQRDAIAQLDAIKKWSKARDEAFHADPVGYTLSNDGTTASRAQDFVHNPSPQTWQAYRNSAVAYQRRIYPDKTPEVMPKEMIDQFRQDWAGAQNSEAGATAALEQVNKWMGITGADWPQVAHELYDKHVLTPSQFGSAIAFSNPMSTALAGQMLKASFTDKKTLAEQGKAYSGPQADYDSSTQQALQPFMRTMQMAPNSGMIGDALFQSVRNYALSTGDPQKAAEAVNTFLGTKYDFRGVTYRVPKDANLDIDAVQSGASHVLDDLPNHNIVHADGSLMSGADKAGMAGQWVTNNDESGLIMYGPNGRPVKERNAAGQIVPLEIKWKDLQKLGQ